MLGIRPLAFVLSVSAATWTAVIVALSLIEPSIPSWVGDASLAVVGWMALEIIRQGRALKAVPTRPLLDSWKAEGDVQHQRLEDSVTELKTTASGNGERINAIIDRLDGLREDFQKLDDRLRPLERRLVTRENRDRRKRKGSKRDRGRD